MSKEKGRNPPEDEIWGPGGLAEQERLRRLTDTRRQKNDGPSSVGQPGIRECKVTEQLKGYTDGR